MNNGMFRPGASTRIPGPLGSHSHPASDRKLMSLSSPSRDMALPIFKLTGPYPRLTIIPGVLDRGSSALTLNRLTSRHEYNDYASVISGHTHTTMLFEVPSGKGRSDTDRAIIPNGIPEISLEGKGYIKIPQGARISQHSTPVVGGKNDLASYQDKIDALRKAHPTTLFLFHVEFGKKVHIIGIDLQPNSGAQIPAEGKAVAHMFTNTAFTSFDQGTLTPHRDHPCGYTGTREATGRVEIMHKDGLNYSEVAKKINTDVLAGKGLKLTVPSASDTEKIILPQQPSPVISGSEITTRSGNVAFLYIDNPTATSHTIRIQEGEKASFSHRKLAEYLERDKTGVHLCRIVTDFSGPQKTQRFEILTIKQ